MFRTNLLLAAAMAAVQLSASIGNADYLVAQTLDGNIVRYDEVSGERIPNWEINVSVPLFDGSVAGLAVAGGVIYASNHQTSEILQYDLFTGAPVGSGVFATLPSIPIPNDDPIEASPGALLVGGADQLLVADRVTGSVYDYQISTGTLLGAPVTGLNSLGALGKTSSGALISTDLAIDITGQSLLPSAVYLGTGSPPSKIVDEQNTALFGPSKMLVNSDDTFWVTDAFSSRVVKYNTAGTYLGEFTVPLSDDVDPNDPPAGSRGPVSFPSGIAALPSGDMLITTLGISAVTQGSTKNYGRLEVYDASGSVLRTIATDQPALGDVQLVAPLLAADGDFNRDGGVNQADFDLWLAGFGQLVTAGSSADGNGDGLIDGQDYAIWRENVSLMPLAPLPVPEPNALAGAAMACLLGLARRRS